MNKKFGKNQFETAWTDPKSSDGNNEECTEKRQNRRKRHVDMTFAKSKHYYTSEKGPLAEFKNGDWNEFLILEAQTKDRGTQIRDTLLAWPPPAAQGMKSCKKKLK